MIFQLGFFYSCTGVFIGRFIDQATGQPAFSVRHGRCHSEGGNIAGSHVSTRLARRSTSATSSDGTNGGPRRKRSAGGGAARDEALDLVLAVTGAREQGAGVLTDLRRFVRGDLVCAFDVDW